MSGKTDIDERVKRVSSPASLCQVAQEFKHVHNAKVIPQMESYNEFCEDEYHEVRIDRYRGVTMELLQFIEELDDWYVTHINSCKAPDSSPGRFNFQSMIFVRTEPRSVTIETLACECPKLNGASIATEYLELSEHDTIIEVTLGENGHTARIEW